MKTTSTKFLIVCLIIFAGVAESCSVTRAPDNLTSKERRNLEKAALTLNFYAQDTVLNAREFVLEADFLEGRRGELVVVSPNINFVKVQGNRGTLQTGNELFMGNDRRGNGLGGVTTEGNIINYKVTGNTRSLTHRVTFTIVTNVGVFHVNMFIMADNKSRATITSTNSMQLTWRGNLVAIFNTRVFRGIDTFRR